MMMICAPFQGFDVHQNGGGNGNAKLKKLLKIEHVKLLSASCGLRFYRGDKVLAVFVFSVFWRVCGERNTGLFVRGLAFV